MLSMAASGLALGASEQALPAIDIPYERMVLPNGLTLIVHEDRKAPLVAVSAWYHVGGKDEPPGRAGFAHLFEHINFSAQKHSVTSIVGATTANAQTRNDYTNYYQTVPSPALDTALWLEARRMGHMRESLNQQILDAEREIVEGEKRFTASRAPESTLETEILWRQTYPSDHPYARSGMGSSEDLNAATVADLKSWYEQWQGAANAVLIVAGDVRAEEVKQKVAKYFGAVPAGPAHTRATQWIAKMSGERRMTSTWQGVPDSRLYKVWNVPGYATQDFALLELAAQVLGEGRNSRLQRRLVTTERSATEVRVRAEGMELGSQLKIVVTMAKGADAASVERAVNEELDRFMRAGPTAAELESAVTNNYARIARAIERLDSHGGKSWYLALGELYAGAPDFYQRSLEWKRVATAAQVQAATQRWLSDGVFVLTVHPQPEYRATESALDSAPPVGNSSPPVLTLPPLQRAVLSNGLKVALIERHDAPLVRMSLLLDAGSMTDDMGKSTTARLTMLTLKEGTRLQSAQQIADRAERLGAQIDADASLDVASLSLDAIAGRVPESLALFSEMLLQPAFRPAGLRKSAHELIAAARQQRSLPAQTALRTFAQALYGDNRAYVDWIGDDIDPAAVESLTIADLQRFHSRWVRPDNGTLLIVGDTTLREILPLLQKHLGAWRAPSEPLSVKQSAKFDTPVKPRLYLVNVSGAAQTEIVAGRATVARSSPSYESLELLNDILKSNLTKTLRESRNLTYDVASQLMPARQAGPWLIRTVVRADRTAEAVSEMHRELLDLSTAHPVSAAQVDLARRERILTLPANNQSTSELANSLGTVLTFNLADEYWSTYAQRLDSLTTSQLQTDARRFLHPEGFTWVLVGDVAKFEAEVRALDVAEVVVMDADGKVLR